MAKKNKSRYFQFLLMVLAAGCLYPMPYLRSAYQDTMLEVFHMTLPQLNSVMAALGIAFTIGYLPSGVLADKFSAKKLVTISMFGMALGGFWFAQIPGYKSVVIIYIIWGFSAVLTFWSAHMKVIKMLAESGEEGRFFGILDGGRGIIEAVLAACALAVFSKILGAGIEFADKKSAMSAVIYMYSTVVLVIGILVAIFIKDVETDKDKEEDKFRFRDLGELFKNKSIFVLGAIIFMSYAVTYAIYYFAGFLQTNIGVSAVAAGAFYSAITWLRPIGGIGGGILADKIGKTKVMIGALSGAAVLLLAVAFIPTSAGPTVFYAVLAGAALFFYCIRGVYWSLLDDCRVENKITGTAIGFASLVGYLPEIFVPMFSSFIVLSLGDTAGNNGFFTGIAVTAVVGVILVAVFRKMTKVKK